MNKLCKIILRISKDRNVRSILVLIIYPAFLIYVTEPNYDFRKIQNFSSPSFRNVSETFINFEYESFKRVFGNKENICKPKTNVGFLKTHKTGSTTVAL